MGRPPPSERIDSGGSLRLTDRPQARATASLTVDGVTIPAVPGESLAAALIAAGRRDIRRDRMGNARGVLCGMGTCFECRVVVDGGAPQRACLTPVTDSMSVQTLEHPEKVPDAPVSSNTRERETIACDVLVIGAGPAGATAAAKLAAAGRRVVVLDERHDAGGQFFKQKIDAVSRDGPDDDQYREGRRLLDRLRESGAELIHGATVWGAFRDDASRLEICASTIERSYVVLPEKLVVAAGAHESVPAFPGWTLPGVMTTGAAQSLVRAYRVAPGRRVLIAGNGPLNLQLACELLQAGVHVVAVAEAAPSPWPKRLPDLIGALAASPQLIMQGARYLQTLRKSGVSVHYGHHVSAAEGKHSVSRAAIARLDRDGRPLDGTAKHFDVDCVCLGYRLRPSDEIPRALGCGMHREDSLAEAVDRDADGETSIAGVYVIGDGATLGGARVAAAEGARVADVILGKPEDRRNSNRLARHRRFQRKLWAIYHAEKAMLADADTIVCRCESVTASTVRSLIAGGTRDINGIKRLCRAGMGPCQGRYCQQSLLALLEEARASTPVSLTARNPVRPVAIADVASEKPEWSGYRSTAIPATTGRTPAPDTVLGQTEVLIIGAGVIGTAAALYLARAGHAVMLVDRGQPNGEASGGNAGSLHLQLLPFDFRGESEPSPAAHALPLQKRGVELWCELAAELEGDFELAIHGGLMLADNEDDLEYLRRKASLERRFGIDTEVLSASETRRLLPGVASHVAGAAFCAGEGKINPMLATPHLLDAAIELGVGLHPMTAVSSIEPADGGYRVGTDRGSIRCGTIVNAAGAWASEVAALVDTTLPVAFAPQQMLVTQTVESRLPFLLALARRHLTMKQTASGNLLIGGGWPAGVDGRTGRGMTLRESIEGNLWVARRLYPALDRLQLIRSWAAAGVMIDGMPIIGELPGRPGFYTVVGANGYTMGPALGHIVADLIMGRPAGADIAPFSARRFQAGACEEPQRGTQTGTATSQEARE